MYPELSKKEQIVQLLKGVQFDRNRHGSLFDRGSADSYYHRHQDPHWYPTGTGNGAKVTNLNNDEIAEYMAGYNWNEKFGDKKDWE